MSEPIESKPEEPIESKPEDEFEHINETVSGYTGDSDDEVSEEIEDEESEEMDDETREKQKQTLDKLRQFMASMEPQWKVKDFINIQKGGTFFYVFLLMVLFQNYNITACVYLSLHGTYGALWLLKDKIFPDKQWEVRIELHQACITVVPFLERSFIIFITEFPDSGSKGEVGSSRNKIKGSVINSTAIETLFL